MSQGECPWCVRVTCQRITQRHGGVLYRCQWSGYRPKDHKKMTDEYQRSRRTNCPWCWSTGSFVVKPVFHKLSTICPFRRFARGSGPAS